MSEVTVDVAAVAATANGLRSSSDILVECARSVGTCGFGPRAAGRNYADEANAVQAGYGRLGRAVAGMAGATAACATALAAGSEGYVETDRSTANSLNGPLR